MKYHTPNPNCSLQTVLELPCGAVIKNRICKSATTEALATLQGVPTPSLNTLYEKWAQGGAGLVISGNVMITSDHLERIGNVILDNDRHIDAFAAWAKAGSQNDTHFWMQINHTGRQCQRIVNAHPKAPSAVQLDLAGNFGVPIAMTHREILETIAQYAKTAKLAKQAGFTGVQIHSAHGYLCNQFLSPITNQRSDEWGGSLENRARFLLSVVKAVRAEVGANFPIGVKLNSSDFQSGGFTLEESTQVAQWLADQAIDLLEISGGTYEQTEFLKVDASQTRDSTRKREAFFLEYAKTIAQAVPNTPMIVTGGFRTLAGMNEALTQGETDMIGIARPACVDPDVPNQLLSGQTTVLPTYENHLFLGQGLWGNNSTHKIIRGLNGQAQAAWYAMQLQAIGNNQSPNTQLTARAALAKGLGRDTLMNLSRKLQQLLAK